MTPIASTKPATPPRPKRMTLANVTRGKVAVPWWILLYAEPKVGKTTFASGAPDPVFLELDNGTKELDVARYPKPRSFSDVLEALEDAAATREVGSSPFRTLVIDPLSQLEPLIHLDVTGGALVNTKKWGGGFGAYENALRDRARVFFKAVERCWEAGLNVMLVGHAKLKKVEPPDGPSYERWDLEGEIKELSGLSFKYCQAILFAAREAYGKVDPDTKKTKAAGSNLHMLYTQGSPSYRAGNRWRLPAEMPLSWSTFAEAMANGQRETDRMLSEIDAGLARIGDDAVTKLVRGWLAEKQDPAQVLNAVRAKLARLEEETKLEATEEEA